MPGTIFAYDIAPQQYVYHTGSGRLDLVRPTPQNRRIKECFVAYVVLKGELNLTDFLPEGPECGSSGAGAKPHCQPSAVPRFSSPVHSLV